MYSGEIAVGVSEALASFVASTPIDVPARARTLYDAGHAALERGAPIAAELREVLAFFGAPAQARVVGPGSERAGAMVAAHANGAAFAGDPAIGESGAVVAAAFAGGELAGASEARIIAAIAIGCEVALRLRRAVTLDPAWDAATVVAGFGAVAAAAHVFTLDQVQARNALGLAATQATGPRLARGTTAGAAALGKAASDAIEAAILARHGFTAAPASVEGRRGFVALMGSRFDEHVLLAGLGEEWTCADP
jgi:2-methylcitrate dehydratase PrpD